MGKIGVQLIYEGDLNRPLMIGTSYDPALVIHAKKQMLKEAEEALGGAESLKDEVLIVSFRATLVKLRRTLDLLVPPEIEAAYSQEQSDDRDTEQQ